MLRPGRCTIDTVALRPAHPLIIAGCALGVAAAMVLALRGLHAFALMLLAGTLLDTAWLWFRRRYEPLAICFQQHRWWLVDREGELLGPFDVLPSSRVGVSWMSLGLKHLGSGKRRLLWLCRANTSASDWSLLHLKLGEQRLRSGHQH